MRCGSTSFAFPRLTPLAGLVWLVATASAGCSGETANAPANPGGTGASATTPVVAGGKGGLPGKPAKTDSTDTTAPDPAPINCTGEAGSFYALSIAKLAAKDQIPLCAYKDSVVLVVNGASGCGYTPQYKPLEALYAKYNESQHLKFEVLAFPSKSFNQEKDTDADVSEFCTTEYAITFPLATIGPVIDDASKSVVAQPVYQWLYAQPGMSTPVAWNFEKFLIGKDGKVVKRWLSATSPDAGGEIDLAIAAELAR